MLSHQQVVLSAEQLGQSDEEDAEKLMLKLSAWHGISPPPASDTARRDTSSSMTDAEVQADLEAQLHWRAEVHRAEALRMLDDIVWHTPADSTPVKFALHYN